MIQPYVDFQERIPKIINLGFGSFSTRISSAQLEEEQAKSGYVEECIYLVELFHVKILSPCVKDDVLNFFILSI